MMHWLRHATGRLWMTLLVGTGPGLWLMSLLKPVIGLEAAPVAMAAWMVLLFFGMGWGANRLGLWQLRRRMHAAEQAARDGLSVEAEVLFRQALALLDSFLISPAARRRNLTQLCARLARFYQARPGASEAFVPRYLAEVPGDGEVAEQWALDLAGRDDVSEEEQGLLARLASAHPRHDRIQLALARVYLVQERTDFPALHCYRRVCGEGGPLQPEVCRAVAVLLQKAGRSDEWVRQMVLRFLGTPPADAAPVSPSDARPAEVRQPETPPPAPEGTDDEGAFRMHAAGDAAEDEEAEEEALPGFGQELAVVWGRLQHLAAEFCSAVASGLRRTARRAAVVRAAAWGRAAAVGLGALLAAGGVWLWVSDADLLREPVAPPPTVSSEADTAPLVTDRFTLQVAAYLKAEYAHKFVESLKSQGFDAYWTETASGGKTWYQVRIAHFPDPSAAREFGSRLKQKGVIEDFYVTNYSR